MSSQKGEKNKRLLSRFWRTLDVWLPDLDRSQQAEVYGRMRNNARANVDFYILIILSAVIAYFGLLQNSAAVIIGAMLVAPLMSPMLAMAHGVVMGNPIMLRRAAISTLAGVLVAIGVAALLTFFLPTLPPRSEILSRTQPTLLDLFVALASGAAAAYALARKELAAALPGVAIAAALVPPLCVVGYGLGSGRWEIASGAALLFLTNLATINLAAAGMFILLGFRPTRDERASRVQRSIVFAIMGVLLILIPLAVSTVTLARQATRESAVRTILLERLGEEIVEVDDIEIAEASNGYTVGFTAYIYGEVSDTSLIAQIRDELSEATGTPVSLRVRVVPAVLARVDEGGIEAFGSTDRN